MKTNEERGENHNNNNKKGIVLKKKRNNFFTNAKSNNGHYNPAHIKKQREFYKNAKNVKKFKKLLKHQNEHIDPSLAHKPIENVNETREDEDNTERRRKKNSAFSLEELYKKKHEEIERERIEREAALRAKKEEKEKAEGRRKAMREKMLKKTRKGQPVMKYRIEHLLETIQGSTKTEYGNKS